MREFKSYNDAKYYSINQSEPLCVLIKKSCNKMTKSNLFYVADNLSEQTKLLKSAYRIY